QTYSLSLHDALPISSVCFAEAGFVQQLVDQLVELFSKIDIRPSPQTQARKPWLQRELVVLIVFVAAQLAALGNDPVPSASAGIRMAHEQRGILVEQALQLHV